MGRYMKVVPFCRDYVEAVNRNRGAKMLFKGYPLIRSRFVACAGGSTLGGAGFSA